MSQNFDIGITISIIVVIVVGILYDLRSKKPFVTKDRVVDWTTLIVAILWNALGSVPYTIILPLIVTIGLSRMVAGYVFEQITKSRN